ncbi:TonB-dependent receptor [Steroidobacter agaridevorans]|uniref:TonB-dependent receptor n=1 Tax=Steroidobacter agaridevorans TaxID=2695856 RepID=A0A829Y9F9_9GAMM|nr:TonB-dependent receptor [Steroidobacter agaridevorans]GFE79488.1 TonB-dependent receptor [Steroidobacter agaridevorans]
MSIDKQKSLGRCTRASIVSLALTASLATAAEQDVLEEVVVTATLRQQSLVEAPVSVTVLDATTLRDGGRQHFEDVLSNVPNLSYASGTSRPRFFQIRGIGEREEWQGAPNPSVGFLIDGIDFSGMGMPATTFDVDRIEVLRGPQGLHYGANALGGLIVMRGRDPEDRFGFATEASVGEYNSQSIGAVATGPVESLNSAWRVAVQNYRSDGFRKDVYLGRDDTMDRDELTARAKWRWRPSESTTVDLTWLHADLDNGYDAWSIDNSRVSLADRPGRDSQKSDGAALRVDTSAGQLGRLTLTATLSDSNTDYSFDADWGNAESWAPYTYDYFDRQQRDRRGRSFEARITSEEAASPHGVTWVAGVYGLDVDEQLYYTSQGVYIDPFFPDYSGSTDKTLRSDYDAQNLAMYAQVEAPFSERWGWSFGLRGEQRDADYTDRRTGEDLTGIDASAKDTMWGGQATVYFDPRDHLRWFATLSRGYKAGGFNLGEAAQVQADFQPESLIGLDVGMKGQWLEGRLYADVTAFYMKRTDMQVAISTQLDPGDPSSYLLYTDNASGGRNMGVESSVRWRATDTLELGGALGLLRTRYSGFRPDGVTDLSDRDQAYAPEYQASVNATWRHPLGWMARVDVAATDNYYFDVPDLDVDKNNYRSNTYTLAHLKAGYEAETWAVYAWGRNVFDEDYYTRGFFFGNEPPDFANKRYTQLGEPRQFGVTFRWEFK